MNLRPPHAGARRATGRQTVSALGVIVLAVACGLAAGYLDVAIVVLKKFLARGPASFGSGADFPWTIPAGHAFLLFVASVPLAIVTKVHRRGVSLQTAAWLLPTLAVWGALLRLPLYGVASLLLATGLGRQIGPGIVRLVQSRRQAWSVFAGLVATMALLAACTSGWRAAREAWAVARLPAPEPNSRNVILIVCDAVRAQT